MAPHTSRTHAIALLKSRKFPGANGFPAISSVMRICSIYHYHNPKTVLFLNTVVLGPSVRYLSLRNVVPTPPKRPTGVALVERAPFCALCANRFGSDILKSLEVGFHLLYSVRWHCLQTVHLRTTGRLSLGPCYALAMLHLQSFPRSAFQDSFLASDDVSCWDQCTVA